MKHFLLVSAVALAAVTVSAPASAAVVGSLAPASAGNLLTLSGTGLSNGGSSVATLSGGTVYMGDRPFADQPAGSIFGGTFLAAGPTSGNTATLTFSVATSFLSFLWGSPDLYNSLVINSTTGGVAGNQTFTAAGLGFPSTNGSQATSQYVRFQGVAGTTINSVSFTNVPSTDAFESANFSIAAVPEPATWALMLVGFGGVGFAMRRRKSKVATRVSFA